jgi:hypothetical protein
MRGSVEDDRYLVAGLGSILSISNRRHSLLWKTGYRSFNLDLVTLRLGIFHSHNFAIVFYFTTPETSKPEESATLDA